MFIKASETLQGVIELKIWTWLIMDKELLCMLQLFQNSMAICREFRKPDLFITMTANPNWPEITAALLQNEGEHGACQTAAD